MGFRLFAVIAKLRSSGLMASSTYVPAVRSTHTFAQNTYQSGAGEVLHRLVESRWKENGNVGGPRN